MSLVDVFQNMVTCMLWGFRDALMGAARAYKMEGSAIFVATPRKKPEQTELARRRAERGKGSRETPEPKETNIKYRLMQCCFWNGGICLLSIFVFYNLVLPVLGWIFSGPSSESGEGVGVWWWLAPVLRSLFDGLWVLPLFVLSKVINCLWFQDIADAAYMKTRGKPQLPSLSRFIADMTFSILLQTLFLIQGSLCRLVPLDVLSQMASLVHMGLLYALYAFEYKWFNMGHEVHLRLNLIESNWVYYFGFGLPLAILTSYSNSLVISGCVFSLLFPILIISANEAEEPQTPFNFSMRIFAPVVYLTNSIYRVFSRRKTASAGVRPGQGHSSNPSSSPQDASR